MRSIVNKEDIKSTFSQNFHKFKLIVIGEKDSGKRSFCTSWLQYEKPEYKTKGLNILFLPKTKDNYEIEFDVINIDPKQKITSLPYADGYILFFSIDSSLSLEPVYTYLKNYFSKYPSLPIILVGNKCDLDDKRKVQTIDGLKTGDTWGCSYVETSSKSKQNVGYVIEELVRKIEDFKKKVKLKDYQPKSSGLLVSVTNDDEFLENLNL